MNIERERVNAEIARIKEIIDTLHVDGLTYLLRNYPRLEECFRLTVKDEVEAGNIPEDDVLDLGACSSEDLKRYASAYGLPGYRHG